MREWLSTSRSINQPLRVFLSLTLGDFFVLLFVFGALQVLLFLSGIEAIFTLLILSALTAALILFRYKRPKAHLIDHVLFLFWKLKGGVIYEPANKVRQKSRRTKLLGPFEPDARNQF
jgi:hypothetical protein